MCFSMTADVVMGTALIPVAVATLREVRHWRELPFALLPTIFAFHQLIEALVWPNGVVPAGLAQVAMYAYIFIALPLLPAWVPPAVLMLEPRGARLRIAPFVVLGAVVSAYLAVVVLTRPVGMARCAHALEYHTEVSHPYVWAALYIIAVIGPTLLSGYRSIVVFGLANLVGLIAVAALYFRAFASLWCAYAAMLSFLVLVHMRRRRRLPDPHRYEGVPMDEAAAVEIEANAK
ncbi:DUF6629 family protein [Mycobacterium sp. 050134]|uniref:DUF6629 family protein n=1 Tax=Mycobacterium sp. 050134 TaxID=3096111 RepID=UPI002ED87C0C